MLTMTSTYGVSSVTIAVGGWVGGPQVGAGGVADRLAVAALVIVSR